MSAGLRKAGGPPKGTKTRSKIDFGKNSPASKAELVEELARRLETRENNDPGRHLFYAALLFVATHPNRTATASQLQRALCIGSGQANKLCSGLYVELR